MQINRSSNLSLFTPLALRETPVVARWKSGYPDMNGKFPWEPGCEQWAIDQQRVLDKPKTKEELS